MECCKHQDFFEQFSAYLLLKIELLNSTHDNLELHLSADDTTLNVDVPDTALYARLSEPTCKQVFVDARFITEQTVALRNASLTHCGVGSEALFSKPGIHRARLLLLSFTFIACVWRPLKEGEERHQVIARCRRLLGNVALYGACEPHGAIKRALDSVVASKTQNLAIMA